MSNNADGPSTGHGQNKEFTGQLMFFCCRLQGAAGLRFVPELVSNGLESLSRRGSLLGFSTQRFRKLMRQELILLWPSPEAFVIHATLSAGK